MKKILDFAMPAKFMMPQMEAYQGRIDPRKHLETYVMIMQVYKASNLIMCWAFPTTLKGTTRA